MPSYNKLPYPEIPLPTTAPTVVTNNTIIKPQKHSSPFAGWTLLPLRLFLAITFVYAGMQKLTDPQFFHKSTPGYIGNQLIALAHGSPLHDLLIKMIPHAVL